RGGRQLRGGPAGITLTAAAEPALDERRERQERGDLAAERLLGGQRGDVEARRVGGAPARLAVRDVAGELALVAHAEAALAAAFDQALDAEAALAARELRVLLGEAAARTEQGRLDRRAAHAQAPADLAVGEALELAHHEDVVMGLGQPAEGAAQVVE